MQVNKSYFTPELVEEAIVYSRKAGKSGFEDIVEILHKNSQTTRPTRLAEYQFYNAFLKSSNNIGAVDFLIRSGRYEEALPLTDNFILRASIKIRQGKINEMGAIDPPSPDCSLYTLSVWLRYHKLNRTLEDATKEYTHAFPSGNGLIKLFLRDYPGAIKFFSEKPVTPCLTWYNAFAYSKMGEHAAAKMIFECCLQNPINYSSDLYDNFECWETLSQYIENNNAGNLCVIVPSSYLIVNYIREQVFKPPLKESFIRDLSQVHQSPMILLLKTFLFPVSTAISLRALDNIQGNAPFNEIDSMVITHWRDSGEFISQYCEMRKAKTNDDRFDEEWIGAQVRRYGLEPIPLDVVQKIVEINDRQIAKHHSSSSMNEFMGHVLYSAKNYEGALLAFTAAFNRRSPTASGILAIHRCLLQLQGPEPAKKYILSKCEEYKFPTVLNEALLHLTDLSERRAFFETHTPYCPEFKARAAELLSVKKLDDAEASIAAVKSVDLKKISRSDALNVLNRLLRSKVDHYYSLLRSFYSFKDKKANSLDDLKHVDFSKIDKTDLSSVLQRFLEEDVDYILFAKKYLPREGKRMVIDIYMQRKDFESALPVIRDYLLEDSSNLDVFILKIRCLMGKGKHDIALTAIEDQLKETPSDILEALKREITSKNESPVMATPLPEAISNHKKAASPKATNTIQTGFVLEKPRTKEERTRETAIFAFGGSKSMKGVPDPIQHASGFDPLAYKPKEEPSAQTPSGKREKPPAAPVTALVETKISEHYKKTLDHARTLLLKIIPLSELHKKGEVDTLILRNNLLYTYLRVFEIIGFKTIDLSLKESLTNTRNTVRHLFNLVSTENAIMLYNNLFKDRLSDQLADWIAGSGILTKLVLSTVNLIDPQVQREWDALSHSQKDKARLEFMNIELLNLVKLMESVKTEGVFAGDGPYENAAKMSIMMIGKCWSKLSPPEKKKLSPYFQDFNLEGNKAAHNFKNESEQLKIKFIHHFDDIALNDMWKFAQDAPKLITFLKDNGSS